MDVSTIYGLRIAGQTQLMYVGKTHRPIKERLKGHLSSSRADRTDGALISPWIALQVSLGSEIEIVPLLSVRQFVDDARPFLIDYSILVRTAEKLAIARAARRLLREHGTLLLNCAHNPFRERLSWIPDRQAIDAAVRELKVARSSPPWWMERDVICPENDCRPVVAI